LAISTNQPISVIARITVKPPQPEDERFGQVAYTVACQRPARKSIDFTTELRNGIIVADGMNQDDLLQEELNLGFPDITKDNENKEANT
jgi:hypothetical protein